MARPADMVERAFNFGGLLTRAGSDEVLFDRCMRGDAFAFSEVYRRYHPRVYAYCLSRVLDAGLAEDAAQEVFVRFLNSEPKMENPRAWLFAVARNVCVDMIRKDARVSVLADPHDVAESPVAPATDVEADRRDQGRTILLAMRRLRPRYRTALVMRELHGLSSAEIAEALETTPGAADTIVCRARDAFGRVYAELNSLPGECVDSFALIYKSTGSGLSDDEGARLDAHLEQCPRCRSEATSAAKPGALAAMLPFLAPIGAVKRGLLGHLLASIDPSLLELPAKTAPLLQSAGMKVAAFGIAAALVSAPAVEAVRSNVGETSHARDAITAVESIAPSPTLHADTFIAKRSVEASKSRAGAAAAHSASAKVAARARHTASAKAGAGTSSANSAAGGGTGAGTPKPSANKKTARPRVKLRGTAGGSSHGAAPAKKPRPRHRRAGSVAPQRSDDASGTAAR